MTRRLSGNKEFKVLVGHRGLVGLFVMYKSAYGTKRPGIKSLCRIMLNSQGRNLGCSECCQCSIAS